MRLGVFEYLVKPVEHEELLMVIDRLQERLSAHTGSRVQVEVQVDPDLGGGIIARIGDKVFDGSVETQLARLHRRLVGAPSAS